MRNPLPSNFGKLAFIALFGAMVTVGAFRAIPKSGTNLLQGVLSPLPTLMLGNPLDSTADEPGDVAKFFAIEWTANGVELVLHRPPALAADALEDPYCWQAKIDGLPTSPSYQGYSSERLEQNEVVVGSGWIAENADGLLSGHVHVHDPDEYGIGGGNVAENLKSTLFVYDVAVSVCKPEDHL